MEQILDAPLKPQQNHNYGGFWIRFAAYFIDGILLWVIQVVLAYAIVGRYNIFESNPGLSILSFLVGVGYFVVMESSEKQATLGKMLLKLKVGDAQGNRISFGNALGRYFAKIPSILILGIGFMMVGWDAKKQGLHDKMADTYVFEG